jgi:glycosyltransferase involved in cell wall biosynthesis
VRVPRPEPRESARAALGLAPDRFAVLLVGRISDWKGQDVLARALAQPELSELGAVGLVAGDAWPGAEGPLHELEALKEELQLGERLRLLGYRSDVDRLLGAADAVVVPSTRPEPFGLVALEGATAGLPVVAAGHGGLCEIIRDGETGLLVPPGNPAALARALRSLADDPALAQRLGAAAAADVAVRFPRERMLERVQEEYEALLG